MTAGEHRYLVVGLEGAVVIGGGAHTARPGVGRRGVDTRHRSRG